MSAKGISWIEANFEKLIVVVMLIAFLMVLIFQFVLQSSAVDVGTAKVPLADAFKPAERAAERLQSQLNDPNPALPQAIETSDLGAEFERAISGGVIASETFFALGDPLALEIVEGDSINVAGQFAPFLPPAPSAPVAASYRATLDPYAVQQIEGLADLLKTEQPYDTPWVSVQGTLSGMALRAAYDNDPDGPSGAISPLPSSWWAQGVGVLDVEVERQKRDVDGNWGPAVAVQRLPGMPSITENLDETATNYRQLESIGAQAARNEDVILRPEFVQLLEGEPWVPPSELPDPNEVGDLKNQIKTLERRIASIDREIQQKQAALTGQTPNNRREEREATGGGGSDEDRRRQARAQTEQRQPEQDSGQPDARTRNIQNQIDRLNEQKVTITAQLTELGWKPSDQVGIANAYDRSAYAHTEGILDTDEINFWVHDLAVEPGATYRYRTRLVFVNPLYGRKSSLDESLHELADAKLTHSPWSDWGSPVGVSWDEYFFLTSATPGEAGNVGKTSATAELYRFYYGYWRKSEVALEPGDLFASEVKLPDGLQRWDVEREPSVQAWKPIPENPQNTNATEGQEVITQVEGIEKYLLPKTLPVSADAWLLDVVASPMATAGIGGQSTLSYEALVRGPDGQITSRSPSLDASLPLLAVIKASAELGANQLPRIPGQAPRQGLRPGQDPRDPRSGYQTDREQRRQEHGGGGGGGGIGGG